MTDRESIHAKLVRSMMGHTDEPAVLDLVADLHAKAKALVALLDDAEVNHGGLVGGVTLRAKNDLRLELSKWK